MSSRPIARARSQVTVVPSSRQPGKGIGEELAWREMEGAAV